jgi:hypothetical protein
MRDASPSNIPIRLLSEALSGPIVKTYKAGGLGLVLILIGTLLTLVAFFSDQAYSVTLFSLWGSSSF